MSGTIPVTAPPDGAAPAGPSAAHQDAGAPARPLRILLATPPAAAIGPIPRLNAILAEQLRALGCEVGTADWGSEPSQTSSARRTISRFRDMAAIWRRTRGSAFDVVVIASTHYGNTLARDIPLVLGLRARRQPAVVHFHGSQPEMLLGRGRAAFKLASRVLVASASSALVLSSEEQRVWRRFRPKTPVYVVKNPFRPAAGGGAAPPAGDPADPPVILFAGRLLRFKGVFDLVEAAALLAADHPELPFRMVMAGEGPEAQAIAALAERLGVSGRLDLPGRLDAQTLAALYRRATVFVLPSHQEGFPTVIPEAMDAGLPIVTTGIRGAIDYLEEGQNALLVPPREPARLAKALATLLADPTARERMGENNRQKVAIFAPDRVAAEYLEVLRHTVAAASGGSE